MKKLLLATTMLGAFAGFASVARADIVEQGSFTSDHCGCGPQASFGTITLTDHENGFIDVNISLLNNNTFSNAGFDVSFGFNLTGNQTIQYTNLNTITWDVAGALDPNQVKGSLAMDGLGNFEYGVDLTSAGSSGTPPSTLSFTLHSITGAALTLASFNELSTTPPGDSPSFMGIDIFSGTNGKTGAIDLTSFHPVPGPLAGAGIPGLLAACFTMVGIARRRIGRRLGLTA
jgi:hypothetical protein